MAGPRKVAIIGAGPSGLAAAKSLIHDHAPGTFSPIIYEKLSHVGGIWPVRSDDHAHIVPPYMPTNASKHIVSFSDLAWDSVPVDENKQSGHGVATFPKAHQVGKYLQAYADMYIPLASIKFGRTVVSVTRTGEPGLEWSVMSRATNMSDNVVTDKFDHVIVASGFFAVPQMPQIRGMDEFPGPLLHSSRLRDVDNLLSKISNGAKIVIVGGSMSGGEAAATVAFHISSLSHHPAMQSVEARCLSVHHITPRPFWSLPPYVPLNPIVDGDWNACPNFLPLDIVLADLSHRPGGQIRFAPSSTFQPEAAKMLNATFQTMLGNDQTELGNGALAIPNSRHEQPPWVIVSTDHAEFVRSGEINVVVGHAVEIHGNTVVIQKEDGEYTELDDVGLVVMATGFSPHPGLSFLSPAIQETLGYDPNNQYDPIKLFNFGTIHPLVPSLGFVGFYRGPYFGVVEQQARFLGALWSNSLRTVPHEPPQSVGKRKQRGQFPMGDYVGLMESLAEILEMERLPLPEHSPGEGPVVPARYAGKTVSTHASAAHEQRKACEAIVRSLRQRSLFAAPAIFRALQGQWKLTREIHSAAPTHPSGIFRGAANMYPRQPTDDGYAAEFLYCERGELVTAEGLRMTGRRSYVYRLSELEQQAITVWFVKTEIGSSEVDYLFHAVEIPETDDDGEDSNRWGSGWRAKGSHHLCEEDHYDTDYWFRFRGIELLEWGIGYIVKGPNKDYRTRTTYVR